MFVDEIVTAMLLIVVLILFAAAIYCGDKRAKMLAEAKNEKDKAEAGTYEVLERLCLVVFGVLFAVVLLNLNHEAILDRLYYILQELEVLTNGR